MGSGMHAAVDTLDLTDHAVLVASEDSAAVVRLDFDEVYAKWFPEVVRWLPSMGCAATDFEDVAQEVFLVVERKLPHFDGRNLAGWLYAIAIRHVKNHRRLAWFRRFLPFGDAEMRSHVDTPSDILERNQGRELLDQVLGQMSDKRRRAFTLFELEGYRGEEIALLESIPLKTVWTRLHHARREFLELTEQYRTKGAR
jgi:RNA polymerase sigma-70 factor (ECF subfamily)